MEINEKETVFCIERKNKLKLERSLHYNLPLSFTIFLSVARTTSISWLIRV